MTTALPRLRCRATRPLVLLIAFVGAVCALPAPATAHSGFQSYVYVSIFDNELDGRVEYPISDLGPALGIEFPSEADDRLDLARERADEIIAYTDANLDLGQDDRSWALRFNPDFQMLETESGDYLQVPFDVAESFSVAPRTFVATYSGIIEFNPERDALFLVENDWGSATFGNEGEHLLGFSVGAERQVIEIEEASSFEAVAEVARRGTVAVDRTLVFLAALISIVAGATLGNRRDGRPTSWRASLERTGERLAWFLAPAIIVTGVLGLTSAALSERFAFGAGALGVLLAAGSILVPTTFARHAAAAAGTASGVVLAQIFVFQQLDRARPLIAFASFTVGVLAAALALTALLLPLALLVRRWTRAGLVAEVIAGLTTLAGLAWFAERVSNVKFPLRTAELTVADLVTSPIVIGALTMVAGALAFRDATSRTDTTPPPVDADRDPERIEA